MHIVIASDSRDRGFNQFLQKTYPFPSKWKISLTCRPEAQIERLRKEVKLTQKSLSGVLQTYIGSFFAGICNFTKYQESTWNSNFLPSQFRKMSDNYSTHS